VNNRDDRGVEWSFWLFMLAFFIVWMLRATVLFRIDASIESEVVRTFYSNAVKLLLWVVPVFINLICVDKTDPLHYLKLSTRVDKLGLIAASMVSAAYFALIIVTSPLIGGRTIESLLMAQPATVARTLGLVSISPLWEEILFRGFVLHKLWSRARFWTANLISSLMFTMAHWPYWIYSRMALAGFARLSASIFVLGLLFGYVFKRTHSLWPAVVVHIVNNFLSSFLNG